jgi:hypothetical protein
MQCGQHIGLKPTRFLCHRGDYNVHGDWEHRLVLDTEQGENVRYGPFVDIMKNMAGPRVSLLSNFYLCELIISI